MMRFVSTLKQHTELTYMPTLQSLKIAIIATLFGYLLPATAMESQKIECQSISKNQNSIVISAPNRQIDYSARQLFFLKEIGDNLCGSCIFPKEITQIIIMMHYYLPVTISLPPISAATFFENMEKEIHTLYNNEGFRFQLTVACGVNKNDFLNMKGVINSTIGHGVGLYSKNESNEYGSWFGNLYVESFKECYADEKFNISQTNYRYFATMPNEPLYSAPKFEDIKVICYR